ncbi:MAG TPA: hypothetical protein VIY49_25125 [Bryobacteraceae bacterium]
MVKRRVGLASITFLTAFAAQADTVTTKDSRSWNGQATIDNGIVTLKASFPKNNQPLLRFAADNVRALELNGTQFNPGAPPSLPPPKPGNLSGTIYLKGGAEKQVTCDNIRLDQANLTCTGAEKGKSKPGTWNHDDVIRIIFK